MVCTLVSVIIITVVIIIIVKKNKSNATVNVTPTDTYDEKGNYAMEQVVFGAPCVNHQFSKRHSITIDMMSRTATLSDITLDRPPSSTPRDMAPVE